MKLVILVFLLGLLTVGAIILTGTVDSRHEASEVIVRTEVSTTQPCSEMLESYLKKAHEYFAKANAHPREYPSVEASTSALAWMQYYKICSEHTDAHPSLTDDRP